MTEESASFNRILVDTRDISGSIVRFSKERSIPLEEIDFDIKQIYTVVESIQTGDAITYKILDGDKVPEYVYTSGEVTLKQFYQILIRPVDKTERSKLIISLTADRNYMTVSAIIKQNSVITKTADIKTYLYNEINKKMAKSNLLIMLFEDEFVKNLSLFVEKLPEKITLKTDIRLIASKCNYYVPTIDDKISFFFLEKQDEQERDENMYDRGFVMSAEGGELLVEYIKPKKGVSSVNCRGEFIEAPEPLVLNAPAFTTTPNIDVQESETKILYYSLKPGNVLLENNKLDIVGKVKLKEINFRKTGSIIISEDKDVSLDVTEENPVLDAIGPNMTVQSKEINIKGSVGNDARIIATSCIIEGTTHSTTYISATNAKIHSLKGILDAETAHVNKLEGGIITAENVVLDNCSNGNVTAKTIKIKNLGSLNTIVASELIDIDEISGTDNKLIFESAVTKADRDLLERFTREAKVLQTDLDDLNEQFKRAVKQIEDNKESSLKIKTILDDDKRLGRTSLSSFTAKYALFVKYVENAKMIKMKLTKVSVELKSVQNLLDSVYGKILHSKVTNNGVWRNFQTIIFRIGDKKEYKYMPDKDQYIPCIGLKKISETEYIVASL